MNYGKAKYDKIAVPYFSNFWKTPEMPVFNCEINLILTWTSN